MTLMTVPNDRSCSQAVELLAWKFDHNSGKSSKGLKLLTLGWSMEQFFCPLISFSVLLQKQKKRIQGIKKALDKRTCGYKRRLEAMTKSTEHLESMVKRVLALGYSPAKKQ